VLPELLDLGARHQDLRALVRRVGDARGAWLATANPDWAWAVNQDEASNGAAPHVDAIAWARLPTDQRAREVVRLRSSDPESARDLVASTWSSDAAADRVALLAALRTGTGPGDEPLLERALDDRSNQVREVAVHLLDALPGSARGGRMAERLRPLLRLKGRLRKSLQVDLPQDPDAIGVRDGLTRPKKVGSVRGWWLQRLAAGAPLEIWTDATDADPATTWRMVDQADARAGIVEAVLARGDQAWAAPIAENVWHPRLLSLVPAERMDVIACRQLANASTAAQVVSVVSAVPTPWGLEFSRAIVKRLLAEKDPSVLLAQLSSQLAGGLDPATRPSLEQWRDRLEGGSRDRVVRICQFLSLVAEIPEAFT
jgi:hypothetical protein